MSMTVRLRVERSRLVLRTPASSIPEIVAGVLFALLGLSMFVSTHPPYAISALIVALCSGGLGIGLVVTGDAPG